MNKELEKLKREVATHDLLIHDIYGSLIRRLNREIDNSALAAKDTDSITELSKKCRFLEIEAKERRKKITKEIRKKEIERKLKDINWTIHYLADLYKGPHYCDAALDLYKARQQKLALMQELVEIEKEGESLEMGIK